MLAQDQPVAQTKTLGTIGYIAPEYGLDGHVSTSGDVYSFGILLLETFTRKKPTDDMFRGDLSLHQWVNKSFPDAVEKVLDPNLLNDIGLNRDLLKKDTGLSREDIIAQTDEKPYETEQILVSIINVALLCLRESPEERINMRDVVVQLKRIKNHLNQLLQRRVSYSSKF
ncbi:hypothetical protein F0562_005288 [Nyssa sinensis]|uniref:Protein kinase domain-containing protein n=1 Tax=Nyssa sinensis TaxID=561372 RepID=A0A5J5AK72_9ASTE|nr:hypothetical protein F0562_005288 [Nyssa sinensis]